MWRIFMECLLIFSILIGFNAVSSENLWPNLSCHPFYNPEKLTQMRDFCKEVLKPDSPYNRENHVSTMKGCMVHFLPLLYLKHDVTGVDFKWFEVWKAKQLKDNLYSILANPNTAGATKEKIVEGQQRADKILKNAYGCKSVFNEVYTEKDLPDSEWGPLYSCIDRAMGC